MDDRDKQRIACTPDDYERIRNAAAVADYDEFFTVVSSPAVPPGTVIVMQSEAEFDRELENVGEKLHAELLEAMERDVETLRARLRHEVELRLIYRKPAPEWKPGFGVVTGL